MKTQKLDQKIPIFSAPLRHRIASKGNAPQAVSDFMSGPQLSPPVENLGARALIKDTRRQGVQQVETKALPQCEFFFPDRRLRGARRNPGPNIPLTAALPPPRGYA